MLVSSCRNGNLEVSFCCGYLEEGNRLPTLPTYLANNIEQQNERRQVTPRILQVALGVSKIHVFLFT